MARANAQQARRRYDRRRAEVVAWVTKHPGATTGAIKLAMTGRGYPTWSLLSSALSRGELRVTGSRSRDPGSEPLRWFPPEP